MFTGIVEETGTVNSISRNGNSLQLEINCSFAGELTEGESVAVNGTCLTVTKKTKNSFCADVTPESFRRTSLGSLESGSEVNLARAMKADGRFGGHIVSGHIDGTGIFLGGVNEGNAVNISVSVPAKIGKYIIEKGSVCIDGISLTVAEVTERENGGEVFFTVAVIPHTWENTTLCKKSTGAVVNIECDVVGKYIEHFLSFNGGKNDSDDEKKNQEEDEVLLEAMTNFTSFH